MVEAARLTHGRPRPHVVAHPVARRAAVVALDTRVRGGGGGGDGGMHIPMCAAAAAFDGPALRSCERAAAVTSFEARLGAAAAAALAAAAAGANADMHSPIGVGARFYARAVRDAGGEAAADADADARSALPGAIAGRLGAGATGSLAAAVARAAALIAAGRPGDAAAAADGAVRRACGGGGGGGYDTLFAELDRARWCDGGASTAVRDAARTIREGAPGRGGGGA